MPSQSAEYMDFTTADDGLYIAIGEDPKTKEDYVGVICKSGGFLHEFLFTADEAANLADAINAKAQQLKGAN